jgi:hypothetical protein
MAQPGKIDIHLKLTPEEGFEFLERLASDDKFRKALRDNPRKAFSQYGITFGPRQLPAKITLPTKERARRMVREISKRGRLEPESAEILFPYIIYGLFLHRPGGRRPRAAAASKRRPQTR